MAELKTRIYEDIKVITYDELESTQDFVKELIENGNYVEGTVIVANKQTKGRGRNKNTWVSFDGTLTFSFAERKMLECNVESLVTGYCNIVCCILHELEVNAHVKWPNDIVIGKNKIAGIIVDNFKEYFIIGIGLNLRGDVYSSIEKLTGVKLDRDLLIYSILKSTKREVRSYVHMPAYVNFEGIELKVTGLKDTLVAESSEQKVYRFEPTGYGYDIEKNEIKKLE